jgi:hypothetical protein
MRRRLGSRSAGDMRRCTGLLVVAWATLGFFASGARADGEASPVQSIRTAKERLGGKASDEQRVDNCKVPLDRRGSKPRPDDCRDGASTEAKH